MWLNKGEFIFIKVGKHAGQIRMIEAVEDGRHTNSGWNYYRVDGCWYYDEEVSFVRTGLLEHKRDIIRTHMFLMIDEVSAFIPTKLHCGLAAHAYCNDGDGFDKYETIRDLMLAGF